MLPLTIDFLLFITLNVWTTEIDSESSRIGSFFKSVEYLPVICTLNKLAVTVIVPIPYTIHEVIVAGSSLIPTKLNWLVLKVLFLIS